MDCQKCGTELAQSRLRLRVKCTGCDAIYRPVFETIQSSNVSEVRRAIVMMAFIVIHNVVIKWLEPLSFVLAFSFTVLFCGIGYWYARRVSPKPALVKYELVEGQERSIYTQDIRFMQIILCCGLVLGGGLIYINA